MHAAANSRYSTSAPILDWRTLAAFVLLTCVLAVPALAPAQTQDQSAPSPGPAAQGSSQTAAAAPQKPAPVTTTVIVHGEVQDNYLPESVTVGTLTGEKLQEAPVSASVITRDLLNDQVSRLLSDVVKNDASVGDDYVPVGYYGVYEIRGFPSILPPDSISTA